MKSKIHKRNEVLSPEWIKKLDFRDGQYYLTEEEFAEFEDARDNRVYEINEKLCKLCLVLIDRINKLESRNK